jgi:hypothetical protein
MILGMRKIGDVSRSQLLAKPNNREEASTPDGEMVQKVEARQPAEIDHSQEKSSGVIL